MSKSLIIIVMMLSNISTSFHLHRRFFHRNKLPSMSMTALCMHSAGSSSIDDGARGNLQKEGGRKPKRFVDFPFSYHEEIIVSIDDITNLGVGVARTKLKDGSEWVIMVPLVLPGEKVQVRIYANRKKYSEADLLKVIDPSIERIEPLCKYFSE